MCSVQDAVNGSHEDVQKLLQKRGGKVFKALNANASAVGEMAEGDRRHAITEILHFASTGNILRMQVLCKAHGIKVDSPTACRSIPGIIGMLAESWAILPGGPYMWKVWPHQRTACTSCT